MTSIGDVTDRVRTWNPLNAPGDSEFDYVDLSAVDNERKEILAANRARASDAPSRARQLIEAGDILVSTVRPNLNAVAMVPSRLDGATASTGFTVLRPTEQVDGRYLFHWVRSPAFVEDMVRKATGASYPAVSDRIVKESTIPLPSLGEQRRIATILDQADAVCAKELRAVASVEGLIGSIFQQIFGTQLANAERVALKSLTSVITKGTTPTSVGLSFAESGVPFLRVQNLADGTVKFGPGDLYIDRSAHSKLARSKVQPGDVLISIAGTIGRARSVAPRLFRTVPQR